MDVDAVTSHDAHREGVQPQPESDSRGQHADDVRTCAAGALAPGDAGGAGAGTATATTAAVGGSAAIDAATALHRLLLGSADTAEILTAISPAAAATPVDGSYALHMALEDRAISGAVVQALIDAAPHVLQLEDDDGDLPLHVAARTCCAHVPRLLAAYPAAARIHDQFGWTPLALTIRSRDHLGAVTACLEAAPDADIVAHRCPDGSYAVHWGIGVLDDELLLRIVRLAPDVISQPCEAHGNVSALVLALQAHASSPVLDAILDAWEPAASLVLENGWTCAHHAIFNDADTVFIQRLLRLAPFSARVKATDGAGYPLHVGLSRMASPDLILRLIELHPDAAKEPANDVNPSWPLHMAAHWGTSVDAVKALIHAHPKAVFLQGTERHMRPLALAKAAGKLDLAEVIDKAMYAQERQHLCPVCHLPAQLNCARCKQQWYCSRDCQKLDWATHRQACRTQ